MAASGAARLVGTQIARIARGDGCYRRGGCGGRLRTHDVGSFLRSFTVLTFMLQPQRRQDVLCAMTILWSHPQEQV